MSNNLTTFLCVSALLLSTGLSCSKQDSATSGSYSTVAALATQTKQRLLADPEVQKALSGESRTAPDEVLDTLARRGWRRLNDNQLFQRITLRRKLLSFTDTPTCAAVVREQATEAQLHTALAKLDTSDVETFFALKETATLAEVKNQQSPRMILEEQLPAAFGALFRTLPPDQAEHLGTLLSGDPARTSDEDICWAEKTFLDALLTVPEPHRSTLARGVVQ